MINIDELLQPTQANPPCGEDYTYHEKFQELERLATPTSGGGVVGTDNRPPEEPNWREVSGKAIEVLKESKHLRAGALLATALVKMNGVDGLRDGIAVMRGLIEKYWGDVYPKLDPSDNNDPTERLNIIGTLSSPKFAAEIRKIVVCATPMVRITLQDVFNAKEHKDKPEPAPGGGPGLTQIEGAFRESGPEKTKATLDLVNEAISHAKGIEGFLDSTLGAGNGVNFEALNKLLAEMKQSVEPYAGDGAAAAAAAPGEAAPAGAEPAQGAPGVSAGIRSGADVIKALELICAYYKEHEPSSPVPFILQRAQRLVNKNFPAIMNDLTPDALRQLEVITGKLDTQ